MSRLRTDDAVRLNNDHACDAIHTNAAILDMAMNYAAVSCGTMWHIVLIINGYSVIYWHAVTIMIHHGPHRVRRAAAPSHHHRSSSMPTRARAAGLSLSHLNMRSSDSFSMVSSCPHIDIGPYKCCNIINGVTRSLSRPGEVELVSDH